MILWDSHHSQITSNSGQSPPHISWSHFLISPDDLLFHAQLNTGFTGLLCLGKLTWPDKVALCNYKKVTLHLSFYQSQEYSFWLLTHKADTTFEGNRIVVHRISSAPDPLPIMACYINSHDTQFPFHLQLWLKADRTIPLHAWFICCLHHYFGTDIAGQSMWAGGEIALAEAGAVPELIKGANHWTSTAFERYIQEKKPPLCSTHSSFCAPHIITIQMPLSHTFSSCFHHRMCSSFSLLTNGQFWPNGHFPNHLECLDEAACAMGH